MLRLALIGYGKMGQAVHQAAQKAGHEVVAIIDPESPEATSQVINLPSLKQATVAIEFTQPQAVLKNLEKLAQCQTSVVIGTTGWLAQLKQAQAIVQQNKIGVLHASNFSQPVYVFTQAIKLVARKLAELHNFDVAIQETHHTGKADAPSGTALTLAKSVLANFPAKKRILVDNAEQPVPPEALQVSATRLGKVVGTHSVLFDNESDTLELIHRGKNRQAYAAGSVAGAEWLVGKTGIFGLTDWLG